VSDDDRALTALRLVLVDWHEPQNVLVALRNLGYVIVTQERLDQLVTSYNTALNKYYEADAALNNIKRAMQLVLEGRSVYEESSTELYDSEQPT
jgi:hypothetical protein